MYLFDDNKQPSDSCRTRIRTWVRTGDLMWSAAVGSAVVSFVVEKYDKLFLKALIIENLSVEEVL